MKKIILALVLSGLATGAASATDKVELDNRIRTLTARFEAMQQKPAKAIPADLLKKAEGIVLMERTKAGFIFAYQGGSGIAMVREPKSREWSPAAFVTGNEASLGFQIGGQQSFVVILLMNTNATVALTESISEFGGEARGTAGNSSAGAEGVSSSVDYPILVFSDRSGLFGGAALKGGAISPANDENRVYYDQFVSMKDILFDKKVKATETAVALGKRITQDSMLAKE